MILDHLGLLTLYLQRIECSTFHLRWASRSIGYVWTCTWCFYISWVLIGLYHPLDGVTNPKYKLLHFYTNKNNFCEEKALAFDPDRCCHLGLCLQQILFHLEKGFFSRFMRLHRLIDGSTNTREHVAMFIYNQCKKQNVMVPRHSALRHTAEWRLCCYAECLKKPFMQCRAARTW